MYNGNILVSGWDGINNSTYSIQLGIKSDTLDQGYLITSDLIEKRLPNLLSNTQDPQPEMPEVFIEISPDDIKISNIISAVDEEIKTLNCKKESKKGCNNKSSKCITHNLWDQLDQHINNFFEKVNLHDLVKKNQTLNR